VGLGASTHVATMAVRSSIASFFGGGKVACLLRNPCDLRACEAGSRGKTLVAMIIRCRYRLYRRAFVGGGTSFARSHLVDGGPQAARCWQELGGDGRRDSLNLKTSVSWGKSRSCFDRLMLRQAQHERDFFGSAHGRAFVRPEQPAQRACRRALGSSTEVSRMNKGTAAHRQHPARCCGSPPESA
jgi:hypothetical protein